MKFKTYQYSKHWTDTQAATGDPVAMEEAKRAKEQLESLVSSILLSENLVILTGLGTSLCIKDTAGNSVAPTMQDLWSSAKKATKDFDAILTKVHQPKGRLWGVEGGTLRHSCRAAKCPSHLKTTR